MKEYLNLGHAEAVPPEDTYAPTAEVFHLPMHTVHKLVQLQGFGLCLMRP